MYRRYEDLSGEEQARVLALFPLSWVSPEMFGRPEDYLYELGLDGRVLSRRWGRDPDEEGMGWKRSSSG